MIPQGARVLLRAAAVDFRKGPEGLVSLVRDAGADPFDGSLYVFRAKRADRIKIVWWDGSGLCLFAKRLERSHFCWPMAGSHEIRLSYAQVMALLEGLDWKRVRAVDVRAPQSAG
jgi:transposase